MLDDKIKISIQDKLGNYYSASEDSTGAWGINNGPDLAYIKHLPKEWDKIPAALERNLTYMGVFRSYSKDLAFVLDGRAILLNFMYGNGGMNAYALIKVWTWNEDTLSYDISFAAAVDFSVSSDDKSTHEFTAVLLEAGAQQQLKASSSNNFNIPFWTYDGSHWVTDGTFCYHDGIKLLYNATFISGATDAAPLALNVPGWDNGAHDISMGHGNHTILAMNQYNYVQNNGTTTFIGNDIMQALIIQGTQTQWLNETNFTDSRPYSKQCYCIKSLTNCDITIQVSGKFNPGTDVIFANDGLDYNLSFVVHKIKPNDEPDLSGGNYTLFASPCVIHLPAGGVYTPTGDGTFSGSVNVSLEADRVYVFGPLYDGDGFATDYSDTCSFQLVDLRVSFISTYNSGTGSPVSAPTFPTTTVIGFTPYDLWRKLVKSIDSIRTDQYGFPVIVGNYTGVSDYFSTTHLPEDDYGLAAQLLLYTSENAVRGVKGIPYLTISPADFFTNWFRMDGLGLGIEGNNIRMEKLSYFFDAATEVVGLGDTIFGLKIEPMSNILFNTLKCGYKEPSTNNDYGVDEYNVPAQYSLPLNRNIRQEDLSVSSPVVGMYEIEKMRAQRSTSDISNPSSSSSVVIMQLSPDSAGTIGVVDPSGTPTTVTAYYLQKYPTAQSTDPTAATAPYIAGLYYPDTAYNVNLIPVKNLLRLSPFLASICDQQEDGYLSYRSQYQMNYADPLTPLRYPSIKTNIYGNSVDSVADIQISDFGTKLFRPYIFRFTAEYPVNIYELLNANPYGYISFIWKGVLFKGFVLKVEQILATRAATQFELIAHPDTTNDMLKMA